MSAQRQLETWTEQAYWNYEENSPVKHEFINGQLYARAGGTFNHTKICGNLLRFAATRLDGKPCDVHSSEQKVKVERSGNTFYPDAVIFCPPSRWEGTGDHTLLTPSVIFEVLSPGTKDYDRADKFTQYRKIESLTDYVLIEAERVYVDHYRRHPEGWLLQTYMRRDDPLPFPDLQIELPLDEVYRALDVPESLYLMMAPQPRSEDD